VDQAVQVADQDSVAQADQVDVQDLVHVQDSEHDRAARRVPVACCRQRARFRADVPLAVLRSVAEATSATRRPKKAR